MTNFYEQKSGTDDKKKVNAEDVKIVSKGWTINIKAYIPPTSGLNLEIRISLNLPQPNLDS